MRALTNRLRRLEERFDTTVESEESRYLRRRLDAARLRCALPQPSPDRLAKLRGMTIPEILNWGRRRSALAPNIEVRDAGRTTIHATGKLGKD